MTWGRYDDNFCDWPVWERVSFPARWHYKSLVQRCCRLEQWDGRLPLTVARRVSDVDSPDDCQAELAAAGGLITIEDGTVRLLRIEEHVPPAWIRKNAELSKIRMKRNRKHKAGDHSTCSPEHCKHLAGDHSTCSPDDCPDAVTRNGDARVTRNTRTQVPTRPGPEEKPGTGRGEEGRKRRAAVTRNGSVESRRDAEEETRREDPGDRHAADALFEGLDEAAAQQYLDGAEQDGIAAGAIEKDWRNSPGRLGYQHSIRTRAANLALADHRAGRLPIRTHVLIDAAPPADVGVMAAPTTGAAPDPTAAAIGERVALLRRRRGRGLDQGALARAVGKSQPWVSRLERGGSVRVTPADLAALAAALGVDVEELLGAAGGERRPA